LKFTKISNKKLIPIQTVELMTMLSKSFNKKSRELRPTLKMLRPGLKKLK
jgi:ribosomal protein L7Ae-like RNA K-turn-binding protein